MNLRFSLASAAIAGLLCSLSPFSIEIQSTSSQLPSYADADGYRVLSAILGRGHDKDASPLRIYALTVGGKGRTASLAEGGCNSRVPTEFEAAVTDFEKRNRTQMKLTNSFLMVPPYKLMEKPDVLEYPPLAPGEQDFPLEDVRPFYAVSAVGFNESRTRAVARLIVYCGSMCYSDGYYLLKESSTGWILLEGSPICEAVA